MFEAVNNITSRVQGGTPTVPLQPNGPEQSDSNPNVLEKSISPAEQAAEVKQTAEETRTGETQQVTEEMLNELERDIETIHSIGLRFSKHDESGRTMIKVMDKQNEELIREIPSEEVLNLAAKIDEMIGILFDRKV
jgi:flagellar protein FlaG